MFCRLNSRLGIMALGVGALIASGGAGLAQDQTKPTPGPKSAYVRTVTGDVFGYFMPMTTVKIGNYELSSFSFGTPGDFESWEKGVQVIPTYAPFMFEFDDVTSTPTQDETGAQGYAVSRRIFPTAYRITPNHISFKGHDAELGDVSFEGTLDLAALKAEQSDDDSEDDEKPIVDGTLIADGKTFAHIKFSWFGGD
ncbi:MAG TPA: hypothetical protein VFI93_09145 [Rhizomicrobium sp.]|nr:hypothetical protein [Rhizomicrobium sp.]